MELMNTTEQVEVQIELLRELSDIELALVGGGMGSVVFDDWLSFVKNTYQTRQMKETIMELMNTTEQVEVQIELLRELADVELALVGGGMGSVVFDD